MFSKLFKKEAKQVSSKGIFGVMLGAGILALTAAFVLTLEKFHLYEQPDAVLSCSINLVLNCSTVMQTWQSQVFGFPNMIIGLMAYASVVTIAVFGLSGVKFPRWISIAGLIGFFLGLCFSYWLFFQSVYAIQVLCPWCLLVTFATTLIFSSMLHYNLRQNTFKIDEKHNARIQKLLDNGFHQMLVIAWFAILVALVVLKFGDALFL